MKGEASDRSMKPLLSAPIASLTKPLFCEDLGILLKKDDGGDRLAARKIIVTVRMSQKTHCSKVFLARKVIMYIR